MTRARKAMEMWHDLMPCWMEENGDEYNTWNSVTRYWRRLGIVPEGE